MHTPSDELVYIFECLFWAFAFITGVALYALVALEHKARVATCQHGLYSKSLVSLLTWLLAMTLVSGFGPQMFSCQLLLPRPPVLVFSLIIILAFVACTWLSDERSRSYSVAQSLTELDLKYGIFPREMTDQLYTLLMGHSFTKFPFGLIEEIPFLVGGDQTPSIKEQVTLRIQEEIIDVLLAEEEAQNRLIDAKIQSALAHKEADALRRKYTSLMFTMPHVIVLCEEIAKWYLKEEPEKEKPRCASWNLVTRK